MKLIAKGMTHQGLVRQSNQDAYLVNSNQGLFVVADGMGGHAGGEIASKVCIEEIQRFISNLDPAKESTEAGVTLRTMVDAINQASTAIYEKALENQALKGMGTTATVLKVSGNRGFLAHVGDSRLYLLRAGFLYQLTVDHSLVSEQLKAGIISEAEAETHHLKNVITRSVGFQEDEEADTYFFEIEPNDCIILSTDGLHGKISDTEIARVVQKEGVSSVETLVDLALKNGGDDNITVIVVQVS